MNPIEMNHLHISVTRARQYSSLQVGMHWGYIAVCFVGVYTI